MISLNRSNIVPDEWSGEGHQCPDPKGGMHNMEGFEILAQLPVDHLVGSL